MDDQHIIKQSYSPLVDKVDSIRNKLSIPIKVMVIFGSAIIVVFILLITADVTGRYFAKFPIHGANEIVSLLVVCLAACGIPYCQMMKGHIRVDFITQRLPPRVRAALDIFAHVLGLIISSLICWQSISAAMKYCFNPGVGTTTSQVLIIPWFPFILVLGIGFGLYALILLADISLAVAKELSTKWTQP